MAANETRTVRAQAKWVRMSARKGRIVAEHIRGRSVPEARAVLAFTPRAAARELEKVLASAVANAEANHGLVGDELVVHAAVVDEGPTLKRWRARARGRVARIKKHTCHITVTLVSGAGTVEPVRRATPAKEVDAAPAPEATEEPRPKRGARPKAAAAEREPEAKTETKPKPRTSRRKKTEETEEAES
jgi:large subunit ribosomal protein L22